VVSSETGYDLSTRLSRHERWQQVLTLRPSIKSLPIKALLIMAPRV